MSERNATTTDKTGSGAPLRWRRIALWTLCSILSLVLLFGVLLFSVDLGMFKPQLERMVSSRMARALHIDGPLVIELGGESYLRAENLRVANASWADDVEMFDIGLLEIEVDLWSLLDEHFVIRRVRIDGAVIDLRRDTGGNANWNLSQTAPADDGKRVDVKVLLDRLDINDVQIVYRSPGRTSPLSISIESLDQHRDADDYLDVTMAAQISGRAATLDGRVGTWGALLVGRNVHFDVEATLDTVSLSSNGDIDNLAAPRRPTVSFSLTGPDIGDLSRMFGLAGDADGTIDLRGSLGPQAGGVLALDVAGNVGAAEIEASGRFSDLQDLAEFDLDLLASGPSLANMLRWFGQAGIGDAPYMLDLNATRRGRVLTVEQARMVFGEAEFDLQADLPNFPSLDDGRIELDVNGPDIARLRYLLQLPGVAVGPFSLSFGLDVSPMGEESISLRGQSNLALVEARGPLGPAPDYFGSELEFRLNSDNLETLGSAWGIENLPNRPLEISGALGYTELGLRTTMPLVADVNGVIAKVEGLLDPRPGFIGTDATFSLTGPDLAALAAAFGAPQGVPAQPYVLGGQLQIGADGYRFSSTDSTVGSSLVDLSGLLSSSPGAAGTSIDFSANGPALEDLFAEMADIKVTPGAFALSGRAELGADSLALRGVSLERPGGALQLDGVLGLPMLDRRAEFDIRGAGSDVRTLLRGVKSIEAAELPFELSVAGSLEGDTWRFERFDVAVGDAQASASGILSLKENAAATRFRFQGNVPSLAQLGTVNGNRFSDQGMSWDGRVSGSDSDVLIDNLLLKIGESDVRGDVRYRPGDVPDIEVDLHSDAIRWAPLFEEQESDTVPTLSDGRIIPDVAIPFDAMRARNASIRIDIGEYTRGALQLRDIVADMRMEDGNLQIPEFGFRGRAGRLAARASLWQGETSGEASLELVARKFAFGFTEINQDLAQTGDIDIKLDARGTDLRSMLGSTTGAILVDARGGRMPNSRFLQAFYGDLFDQVFGTINPFSKQDEYTMFDCIVLPYKVDDGVLMSEPNSFVSTSKIRIASEETINLKTEEIELNVRTTPKKAIGISAGEIINPYIKIVGTIGEPRLDVNEKGVLISGGAAIATAGLSIFATAAWDRLSRAKDPCAATAARAREVMGARFPVWDIDEALESAAE